MVLLPTPFTIIGKPPPYATGRFSLYPKNYFFLAASIACFIARRFFVFLERDVLFLTSCDARFAIDGYYTLFSQKRKLEINYFFPFFGFFFSFFRDSFPFAIKKCE